MPRRAPCRPPQKHADAGALRAVGGLHVEIAVERCPAARQHAQPAPAAAVGEAPDRPGRLFRDQRQRRPALHMRPHRREAVAPQRAHRAGFGVVRRPHEVIDQQPAVPLRDELRQPHPRRAAGRRFEELVILGRRGVGGQAAPQRRDLFATVPQRDLRPEKRFPLRAIVGARGVETEILHRFPLPGLPPRGAKCSPAWIYACIFRRDALLCEPCRAS